MTAAAQSETAAALLFASSLALGFAIRRPLLSVDAIAARVRGHATRLAVIFTESGRTVPLLSGYVAAIAGYAFAHVSVAIPLTLAAWQIFSQLSAEAMKAVFRRTRPDYWLVGREAGHSYPSGHATTAMVTYAGWALVAASSSLALPFRELLAVLLCCWAAGVIWSRLALGAHFLTDVAGGILLGGAWLSVFSAVRSMLG